MTRLLCVTLLVAGLVLEEALARQSPAAAPDSVLTSIASHNSDRRQAGRVRTGVMFFFIAAGMVSLAVLLAVLLAWFWRPWDRCFKGSPEAPTASRTKRGTVLWFVLVVIVLFIASSAGGLPGWSIVGFIYSCACLCLGVASVVIRRDAVKAPRTTQVIPVGTDTEGQIAVATTKVDQPPPHWVSFPQPLSKTQYCIVHVCVVLMLAFLILCFIVFYSWTVPEYKIWQRETNTTAGKEIAEYIPKNTAKAIQVMYVWEAFATNLRLDVYAQLTTSYCGNMFTEPLSDSNRKAAIYTNFVDLYKIDMSIFTPSDWKSYDSVNSWFVRKINPAFRPAPVSADDVVVAPADSRVLVFPKIADSKIWIKGQKLTVKEILNADATLLQPFEDGTLVICRLAPQDYHRFHTAIAGELIYSSELAGTLWSVNPDAIVSGNKAFANVRKLMIFQNPVLGKVLYAAIGATCVGSVVLTKDLRDTVSLGDEVGYMQFGGSTVLMLFQSGKVKFDPDLVRHSAFPVETLVNVNDIIGVATST
eukprot:TRINITY_DN80930_c0_g1_i1.p1 TRINITY_DN80930_c0_g1~~TRINITY_DN80930_c0_g1_i1.p1  ORF type:complete len:531 (+),score=70.20 TRINITY_DN80930_c0_g1_i1:63-1655(+)